MVEARRSGSRHGGSLSTRGAGGRYRRGWSVLGVFALALPLVAFPATSASAAEWGIQKQVTSGPGPYEPGQQVQYAIQISCSDPNADPCVNTVMTDPLPDELILVDATISSQGGATGGEVVADTETNTVTYTADSNPNGQQALITVTAQVDPDLPYSENGVPIPNTATVESDNAPAESSTVEITPIVELNLASETAKTIEPEGALAEPGTAATMTLEATNSSNAPVDTLVIQDPADPTATPNPFTYLEYTSTGDIALPPNADTVEEEYWDGDSWEPLDDSVDPTTVQGVRYTFSGDILPQATATVPVNVQQSEAVEELNEPTTVTNEVSSYVTLDDTESDPVTASDTYLITPPNTSVTASKSFSPSSVSAGDPTTVTLGATNTGTPVDSLTIIEPAPGTNNPFEGDDPITFTGWGTDGAGAGVVWPDGATGASVTFVCDGTPGEPIPAPGPNTLPDPPADCNVTGFTIEYTGNISNGAEATVPFTADTDADQEPDNVEHPNEIEADVPSAEPALADDTLVTLVDRLATDIEKIVTPSTIPAVPGQSVVVQLPSSLLPFGPEGSTTNANEFIVQEPVDPANPGEFWENFEATGVRSTDVPANATLTVEYWDGDSWEPAPGCGPTDGPATVDCDLPAGAEGVRFVYTSDEGFPPGTEFQPNFTADYTGPTDRDDPIENCGYSAASADTVEQTVPVEGCDTVDPFPVDGDGPGDFLDKTMLGDPATVRARTDDQVTAQITWSTGGFSGVDPMVISDIQDPETTAIEDSFYDAFNLVSIAVDDPLIQYDQVESVELFIDGEWVEASGDPCPGGCDGTFPGYTLTADEQESATSARLTFTESPSRTASPADPTAPASGEGVARSTQESGRHLDFTFQVRDYKRSDGEAVLGATNGTIYNTDDAGVVNDTAEGTATYDGEEFTDADADTAQILDVPLNVTVTKDWSGGPVSVPPDGTPEEFYPSTVATITGTNNSAAKVEQLRLVDPVDEGSGTVQDADDTPPFNAFNLTGIDLAEPAGTETTTVTLHIDGESTVEYTGEEAEALAPEDLADVIGIEVAFDGLVEPAASGSMALTLQLREFERTSGDRVTVADFSPVPNESAATIDDPGGTGEDVRLANDDATMELQDAAISLEVTKAFSPDTIVEPNHGNPGDTPVVMTLTGQPQGPSRSVEMVLTDDDPQFWNQYDFVGFDPSAALVNPIDQVQVDAFTGGTFSGNPDSPDPVERAGGDWVEGAPGATFALPDGVDPADVQGLRFTFTRADGAVWENPATPTQPVPIQILRRDDMRSGGPVLPDLEANPTAPGETAEGVASNSVQGTTTGADLVVDPETGDLVPVTAEDEAESSILYQHSTNGVTIVKDFRDVPSGGTEAPDADIPMNITFTNTGDRPIIDPVVTDPMPQDDEGPQLTLADVEEPFSYALGGLPDPDPSTPDLPTDAAEVTVNQAGDIESLEFSFPEGSVLEVGQSYTITVQVNFRLGLAPQTLVQNTAGVTGDRPWDECSPRLDEETGQCQADADVAPSGTAVLQQEKLVKATEDDELDVILDPAYPDQSFECTPDGDGFYVYPCTPVIAPGHNETWRINVENVGNLPMNKLVLYDRLPTPGDIGSFAGSERGSQWTPILTNDPPPEILNLPVGAEAQFFYSTVQDYCMDDINDPMNAPICPQDNPETGWVPLTGDESDEVFQSIAAIKLVVNYAEANLFEPGDVLTLEGTTTTPPESPEAGDRSIAWNSAASSGVTVTAQGNFNILPTEGVKVGVATASGPLQVDKSVTGDGAAYAPDFFEVTVECTSAVGTWVETELDPITITVTPGTPVTVPNLPFDAECTLSEDDSAGQTDYTVTPETVTISTEGDPPSEIAIENTYDLGGLELSKLVESAAVDADGNPIAYGPFEATVECTFLGDPVFAEGYDVETPMVTELSSDGTPVEFTGLPVNSECTITETGTANAESTSITVTQPGEDPVTTDGPTADVVVVPDDEGTPGTAVEVTNTFAVGSLQLDKVRDGAGADEFGEGPFVFDVVCTSEGAEVYNASVTLDATNEYTTTIDNLPAGASCEITETDDGGATSTVIAPNPVTVTGGETAVVTATNVFDLGTVQVDKDLAGLGALYGPGPFEVSIECTDADGPVEIPGGDVRTLVPGTPVLYEGLPVGAECTVTETDTFGASSTSVSVDGGDPVEFPSDGGVPPSADVVVPEADDGEPVAVVVTVTNTFDTAPLAITKVVDGDGAEFAPPMPDVPDAPTPPTPPISDEELADFIAELQEYLATVPFDEFPYQASLACTFEGADVPIPGGADRRFGPGFPALYFGLPEGAECTISESDVGGATEVTIEPNPVQIVDTGDPLTPIPATITNTYDVGQFSVDKVVDGDGAEMYGDGPFEVSAECTFVGQEIDVPGGATRTVAPDSPAVYDGLPVGASCTVTETVDGGATAVTISSAVEDGTPGEVVVPAAGDTSVAITVTNTFDVGEVVVEKVVDGDGAEAWGSGPFAVELACTFNGSDIEVPGGATQTLTPGGSVTYENLPVGAECSVTETDDGSATSTSITPESVTVGPLDEDPVTFTVTNTFNLGSVQVDKELAGLGALYGPGPFEVELTCTFNGAQIAVPGGATRTLVQGDPVVYDGLPVGAECTVTETDTFGASSTSVSVDGGDPVDFDGDADPFVAPSADVVVPPNDDDGPTAVEVSMTNTFETSPLLVEKVVDGDAAQFAPPMPDFPALPTTLEELADYDFSEIPFEEFPYEVELACTFDDGTEILDLPIPGGETRRFGPGFPGVYFGIPDGAECTVTETDLAGATAVTIDPETLAIDGDAPVTDPQIVTVTNTYDAGAIQVDKVVDGDAAQFGVGPFEVSLACTFEGQDIEIPDGAVRTLVPGEPALYEGLPVDAECVVTETEAGGATSSFVSTAVEGGEPGQAVVPPADADPAAITVTNTFDAGAVAVTKEVVFDGASYDVGPFEVTLACTFQGEDIEIPEGAVREISGGETVVYDGLPVGADCVVTESDDGGAAGTAVSAVDDGDPGVVTIAAGEPAAITVTNMFPALPEPPTQPDTDPLPRTGAFVLPLLGLAVLLVTLGGVLTYLRRREAD